MTRSTKPVLIGSEIIDVAVVIKLDRGGGGKKMGKVRHDDNTVQLARTLWPRVGCIEAGRAKTLQFVAEFCSVADTYVGLL